MIMMDTSAGFPDSTVEQEEAAFPCKGCGEVLFLFPTALRFPYRHISPSPFPLLTKWRVL